MEDANLSTRRKGKRTHILVLGLVFLLTLFQNCGQAPETIKVPTVSVKSSSRGTGSTLGSSPSPLVSPSPSPSPDSNGLPLPTGSPSPLPSPTASPMASPSPQNISLTDETSAILEPSVRQVFQKSLNGFGKIKMRVKVLIPELASITVSVTGPGWSNQFNIPVVKPLDANNSFVFETPQIPAGGWYSLQVKQIDSATGKGFVTGLNQVGIGDVFVIAGQSNAANHSQAMTYASSNRAVAYNPYSQTWEMLNDSMPFASGSYGSIWPKLASQLANELNYPVAFVNTAVAGSGISAWQKGAPTFTESSTGLSYALYARLANAAGQVSRLSGGIRAVLWVQGEYDAVANTSDYVSKLQKLARDLKSDLSGIQIPWMIAMSTFFPKDASASDCGYGEFGNQVGSSALRAALLQLLSSQQDIANPEFLRGPDLDDLVGSGYRWAGAQGGCVHYSEAGQAEVSRRWFAAMKAVLYTELPQLRCRIEPIADKINLGNQFGYRISYSGPLPANALISWSGRNHFFTKAETGLLNQPYEQNDPKIWSGENTGVAPGWYARALSVRDSSGRLLCESNTVSVEFR